MALNRKVAIVTGGAHGIGKAIAQSLIHEGYSVVIVDTNEKAGKSTQNAFAAFGEILFIKGDVSKESDVQSVVKRTIKHYGRIDILINNAGKFLEKSLTRLSLQEWNDILSVNLTGAFLFSKYAASYIKKKKGSIINIASTRAFMSEPNTEAYAASKGGLFALTHALAMSLGPEIRVNSISPGWIETQNKKHSKAEHEQHPAGRIGKPEDVAQQVLYLISDQANFMTGANIVLDGGMTRKMIYK